MKHESKSQNTEICRLFCYQGREVGVAGENESSIWEWKHWWNILLVTTWVDLWEPVEFCVIISQYLFLGWHISYSPGSPEAVLVSLTGKAQCSPTVAQEGHQPHGPRSALYSGKLLNWYPRFSQTVTVLRFVISHCSQKHFLTSVFSWRTVLSHGNW